MKSDKTRLSSSRILCERPVNATTGTAKAARISRHNIVRKGKENPSSWTNPSLTCMKTTAKGAKTKGEDKPERPMTRTTDPKSARKEGSNKDNVESFVDFIVYDIAKTLNEGQEEEEEEAARDLELLLWQEHYGLTVNAEALATFLQHQRGLHIVIEVMVNHCTCRRIQELGVAIFYILFRKQKMRDTQLLRACSDELAATGLVGMLVGAMENCQRDDSMMDLQDKGIVVLNMLLCHSLSATALFVKIGAIPFLLETMQLFPKNAIVQEHCARIFQSLHRLRIRPVQDVVEDSGGLVLLTKAMDSFGRNTAVYAAAKDALQLYIH